MMARSINRSNQRPDILMQDRKAARSMKPLATHGRTIQVGQERRFRDVRSESGLPPTAERSRQRSEPTSRAITGHPAPRCPQGRRPQFPYNPAWYRLNANQPRGPRMRRREFIAGLGGVEGRNVRFDHRWAALDEESVRRFAGELVALQPDVILTQSTPNTAVMQQQTRTIPIVLTQGTDPVGAGFVASLSRPGGNVTGFINLEASLGSK